MTFLFDIGKVLLDFDFESSLRRLLPPEDPRTAAFLARILERKDDFERGDLDLESFVSFALDGYAPHVTTEAFLEAWRRIFTPNEPMWAVARSLSAAGHRLILFSNINPIHWPWIDENYDIFRTFDAAVLSFEVGSIKPEDAIYRHAIERFDLVPERTLYADDLPANVATGVRLGFRTHQYDLGNHAAFERWLAEELERLGEAPLARAYS